MRGQLLPERRRQIVSLARRLRELLNESARAARELIADARPERRSSRQAHLEREFRRLRSESERLEAEATLTLRNEADVRGHLEGIERQLREALAERDEWRRESLRGRRRRAEDRQAFERLKEEQERLTAELLRCAAVFGESGSSDEEPRMRRLWKMLRLSGS